MFGLPTLALWHMLEESVWSTQKKLFFSFSVSWVYLACRYMSIYTSNGVSLHQLSLEISKNRKSSPDESDDLCSICKDGGELLCCDNCPRAFHIGESVVTLYISVYCLIYL